MLKTAHGRERAFALASQSNMGRPHCSHARRRPRFRRALPWVVECPECGLAFADPQPSDDELGAIYDEHYYEQFGFASGPHANNGGLERMKRATYARMLAVARPEVQSSTGRLLDVGCGVGFSLLAAAEAGFEALGLDPLAPADPAERPGRHIARGTLETFSDERGFDVVSMIDVIEHVRDPVATLARAGALLAPGGVLLLATNDSSSFGARLLGPRWTHYHRAHLWFFTPRTLGEMAEQAGLEVVRREPARRVYNLEYLASVIARGENFALASALARLLLRITPARLSRLAFPPVPEGFVLVARTPGPGPGGP
jgi:SAM-dependent methyltransferase